jgi:hypothetical protein
VAAVQRIAEKKQGDAAWSRANAGTALGIGSRLRTGKRSKADIRFTDASLLRLGQLSSVEFRAPVGNAPADVALTGGQVLYAALKPGRVIAGAAAAEIKGSVALVRLNTDESVDAELFIGATDIGNGKGQVVSLKPGQGVTVFKDGRFSRIRTASPRAYSRGGGLSELFQAPTIGPFTGSTSEIPVRTSPERTVTGTYTGVSRGPDGLIDLSNPALPTGRMSPFGDFPDSLPPLPGTGLPVISSSSGLLAQSRNTLRTQTLISPRTSLSSGFVPRGVAFDGVQLGGPTLDSSSLSETYDRPEKALYRLAQAPRSTAPSDVPRVVNTAHTLADKSALDTAAAQRHLDEIDRNQGKVSGVDGALLGVLADGGTALYGGQLHGFMGTGKFLVDVSVQPLRLRRTNQPSSDYSAFNSANVRYRDAWGEIQAGRQRFVSGPTQVTLFGSLVRQGSREIMDAVRVAPRVGKGVTLEAAYLIDAYPRNLPYRIAGRQRGFYARAATERRFGNFGVNLLNYRGLNTSTGATVDFALPLVRDKVELYGEAGRDVFRRRMTTVGLAFPALFDSAGVDLAVEYANVGSSSRAIAPPRELAVRAYKRVGNNVDMLATLSRFSGTVRDTSLVVGVSIGARLVGNGNSYSQ